MKMWKVFFALFSSVAISACTTVTHSSIEADAEAKKFTTPSGNNSGIYVYRDGMIGGAYLRKIWTNDDCIGAVARNSFIYKEVPGGKKYTISTSSAIGQNSINIETVPGKNYFIRQYLIIVPVSGMTYLEEKKEIEALDVIKNLRLLPNKCDY